MKFRVTVKEIHSQDYIVEANSKEEAKGIIENGGGEMDEGSFCYDYTLESDYWTIIEEE